MSKRKFSLIVVLATVIVLLLVRVSMPTAIQWFVNNQLDRAPTYDGEIGDIDLHIFRGAYSIDDLRIVKQDGGVPVPLFAAESVDISILWSALLRGALVAEVDFYSPAVNFVDSTSEEKIQTGEEGPWLNILNDLVALRIDRADIHNGSLHFRNFDTEPVVDIYLTEINGSVLNLTNSRELSDSLVARAEFTGIAMENSELSIAVEFDPEPVDPRFNLNARLLSLPLLEIDDFISAYAPFDVEAGSLDIVTQLVADEGRLEGYVKPLIHDLEIFRWKEDVVEDGDNPLQALWENVVGFFSEVLQNQPRDQVATNIPISGDISNLDIGLIATIGNIFRNAFIEGFRANFDNDVSIEPQSN